MGTKGKTRHGWASQGRPLHASRSWEKSELGLAGIWHLGLRKKKQMGREWDGIVRGTVERTAEEDLMDAVDVFYGDEETWLPG